MCKPGTHLFGPIKPFVNTNTILYKQILAFCACQGKKFVNNMIEYDKFRIYEYLNRISQMTKINYRT